MSHTFDIRFARSTGFAAVLEAPANTFRWKGGGSLSIDADGVEISRKRGLLSLLVRRTHFRINASALREVFRAGDALRLEFGTPGTRRSVVPFWVRDQDTAEEIMRLMPTERTIELVEEIPPTRSASSWLKPAVTLVLLALVAVAMFALTRPVVTPEPIGPVAVNSAPSAAPTVLAPPASPVLVAETPEAAPLSGAGVEEYPSASMAIFASPSRTRIQPDESYVAPDLVNVPVFDGVVPIMPGDPAYATARSQLDFFLAESNLLQSDYLYGRTPPGELETKWWALSQRLYLSPEFENRAIRAQIDAELAASQDWRGALSSYAEATDVGSRRKIDAARADLQRADQLTERVKLYVY